MTHMPLLLLPGTLCDHSLWEHQRRHLADSASVEIGALAEHARVADAAQALLAAAPPRFALAGFSLGGIVALEIARQAPERVARLALLNTSARALTPEQAATWETLGAQAERGGFDQVIAALLPPMVAPERRHDAALQSRLARMAHAVGVAGFLRQVRIQLSRRDNRDGLPMLSCPTLVIAGRQDRTSPLERQQELVAALPNAALAIVERCGHLSPLEQPDEVTALLLSWLQTDTYLNPASGRVRRDDALPIAEERL